MAKSYYDSAQYYIDELEEVTKKAVLMKKIVNAALESGCITYDELELLQSATKSIAEPNITYYKDKIKELQAKEAMEVNDESQ